MFRRSMALMSALLGGLVGLGKTHLQIGASPLPPPRGKAKAQATKRRKVMLYRGRGAGPKMSGIGPKECERRRRQIASGMLKPQSRGLGR